MTRLELGKVQWQPGFSDMLLALTAMPDLQEAQSGMWVAGISHC